jgi:hypothetical protein
MVDPDAYQLGSERLLLMGLFIGEIGTVHSCLAGVSAYMYM